MKQQALKALIVLAAVSGARAAPPSGPEAEIVLDPVIVTGSRHRDRLSLIPRGASVIERDTLDRSTAPNLGSELQRETGVDLRSLFGNDRFGTVDIRGMGDTASSNVLMLLDGFRISTPDLTGPDFGAIDLADIERIEIVRGSGSVLYGDGAVGGVINLLSRAPGRNPGARLRADVGSFDSAAGSLRYAVAGEGYSGSLNASTSHTDGWRENSSLWRRDSGARVGLFEDRALHLVLGATRHDDRAGMPGPLPASALGTPAARTALFPTDVSETAETRWTATLEGQAVNSTAVRVTLSRRERENSYCLGCNAFTPPGGFTGHIEDLTHEGRLDLGIPVTAGPLSRLRIGLDVQDTDHRDDRNTYDPSTIRTIDVDLQGLGGFVFADLAIGDAWVSGGLRSDRRTMSRRDEDAAPAPSPPKVESAVWHHTPWEIGAVLPLNEMLAVFASLAESFRNPNADELSLAQPGFQPQSGHGFDLGIRRIRHSTRLEATLFGIRNENEIWFDATTNQNGNYPLPTERLGIELGARHQPIEAVDITANTSFVRARFSGTRVTVPLVPAWRASLVIDWRLRDALTLQMAGHYESSRFDGNDWNNSDGPATPKLAAFSSWDLGVRYRIGRLTAFATANNVFDAAYATTSYSGSLYPLPGQSLRAGVEFLY